MYTLSLNSPENEQSDDFDKIIKHAEFYAPQAYSVIPYAKKKQLEIEIIAKIYRNKIYSLGIINILAPLTTLVMFKI